MADTITQLPPAPQRSDAPADFVAKADAHVASLTQFVNETNTLAASVEVDAQTAETKAGEALVSATTAQNASDTAAASANFKGEWASLTGSIALPASVLHNNTFWQLLNGLADITTSEPGVTADWADTRTGSDLFDTIAALDALAPLLILGQRAVYSESGLFRVGDGVTAFADLSLQGQSERTKRPIVHLFDKTKMIKTMFNELGFDFRRTTTRTYEDLSGIVRTAAIDEMAMNAGLWQMEGERTNVCVFSRPDTANGWTELNTTLTINDVAQPDLGVTATKMEVATASAGQSVQIARHDGAVDAGDGTYSIDIISDGSVQWVNISVQDAGANDTWFDIINFVVGTVGSGVIQLTAGPKAYIRKISEDGWARIHFTVPNAGVDATPEYFLKIVSADGVTTTDGTQLGDFVHVENFQNEFGDSSTSRIKTNGATATRTSDFLDIELVNNLSNKAGSVFSALTNGGFRTTNRPLPVVSVGNDTLGGLFNILTMNVQGFVDTVAGQVGVTGDIGDFDFFTCAATWDQSANQNQGFLEDKSNTISSGVLWDDGSFTISIGRRNRSAIDDFVITTHFSDLMFFDFALTPLEFNQLRQLKG